MIIRYTSNRIDIVIYFSILFFFTISLSSCASSRNNIPMQIKQGVDLHQEGKYDEAIDWFNSAIKTGKITPSQAKNYLDTSTQAFVSLRSDMSSKSLSANDLNKAIEYIEPAYKLVPKNARVISSLKNIVVSIDNETKQLDQTKKYQETINIIDKLKSIWAEFEESQQLKDFAVEKYSKYLSTLIQESDLNGRLGSAYYYSVLLLGLHPLDAVLAEDVGRRRSDLIQRYQIPVTWNVGNSTGLDQNASTALAGIQFNTTFPVLKIGSKQNESLHLSLSHIESKITQSIEQITAVKKIPQGKRQTQNTERLDLDKKRKNLETEVHQLEDKIDSLRSQLSKVPDSTERIRINTELNRMEREHHQLSIEYVEITNQIASKPIFVEVSDYQDIRYPAELYKKVQILSFKLNAASTRKDLPLKVSLDLTSQSEDSCEVHLAVPLYGISEQSLFFKKSNELLVDESIQDLVRVVGKAVDTLVKDFLVVELVSARQKIKQGKNELAIDQLVHVIFGSNDSIPDDIVEFFRQQGVSDLSILKGSK